ncbi:EthD domain-containing protein [Pseudomonas marincola]|uniref:EthD domain-containing protein n=1 Tax=Pseudomonas marincola TaxID=437900 RepID=UPI0008E0064E|nr:EthD domain-containing protein [Pseudomonas marincola]SFU14337.1 EthD domain-containing protein [Pseudomonas marincola]
MKAISLITRKTDTCRDTFRRYYENTHCRLAIRNFPYQRYTRNYLKSDALGLDFDCISEFQMASDFDSSNIMHSRSRKLLEDDEHLFMQPEKIRVARADETILLDRTCAESPVSSSRYALLFKRCDMEQSEFCQRVEAAAQVMSWDIGTLQKLSLDMLKPLAGERFPFDAILWMQTVTACMTHLLPAGVTPGIIGAVAVHTHATSRNELQQGFVKYLP